jgi:uncharacterized membrane protein
MRGLKTCLWIAAIGCLLSVIGLILPLSTWESIAKFFGIESIPASPLVPYLLRVMTATYAVVGVFFLILAFRPMDYGIMVPFSGLSAVVLGVVCVITGLTEEMPALWYLGDGLSCALMGLLIVLFWQKAKSEKPTMS